MVSLEGILASQAPKEMPSEVHGKQQLSSERDMWQSSPQKPCLGKAGSRVRRDKSPKWCNSES